MAYTPSIVSPSMPSFLDWDEEAVAEWLDSVGYGQYRNSFIDQGITGDVLALLNASSLSDLGIPSLGHRLAILKAVYGMKLALGTGIVQARETEGEDFARNSMEELGGDGDDEQRNANWEWGEEDWRPAGEDLPTNASSSAQGMASHFPGGAYGTSGGGSVDDAAVSRLWEAIRDQNDRMALLEKEYRKLLDVFESRREERDNAFLSPNIRQRANSSTSSSDGQIEHLAESIQFDASGNSSHSTRLGARDRQRQDGGRSSGDESGSKSGFRGGTVGKAAGGSGASSVGSTSTIVGRDVTTTQAVTKLVRKPSASRPSGIHSPEQNVLSPSFHSDPPPNPLTSTAPASMAKGIASKLAHATPPPLARMMSSSGIMDTPVTADSGPAQQQAGSLSTAKDTPSKGIASSAMTGTPAHIGDISASSLLGREIPHAAIAPSALSRADTNATHSGNGSRQGSAGPPNPLNRSAKDAPVNPQKSLRTNMNDPCWKVLPAALKKYKIVDDWRQYAMFICYGETERCLSYDEKPLLLFQKLKEANLKPVFMLRHIRDIKSPIAIAVQKQAQRSKSREPTSAGKPQDKLATPHSSSPKGATSASNTPAASTGSKPSSNPHPYSRDTRLHRPPVLQPISAKARAIAATGTLDSGKSTPSSANGKFPELPSPGMKEAGIEEIDGERKLSYVVSIYPYTSEREDEFDVVVGTAFIVLNKIKGWWVVQRDPDGTGAVAPDINKSCLLETSRPIGPAVKKDESGRPSLASQPIPPATILSSSFQGIVLMDYDRKSGDELQVRRNDMLKVFKRYAHWSYAIKESDGERGWVPSWYVGKMSSSGSEKPDKSTSSVLGSEKAIDAGAEAKA